jgi:L-rhamnose mutarotase
MKRLREIAFVVLAAGVSLVSIGCAQPRANVQRFGSVIGIKKESIPEYKRLHAAAWPGVLKMIRECNIRNYSIYLAEVEPGKYYLFSYFEYVGTDFQADMARMKADKTTQEWWKHTDPLQSPIALRKQGEWWMGMEEVFHAD